MLTELLEYLTQQQQRLLMRLKGDVDYWQQFLTEQFANNPNKKVVWFGRPTEVTTNDNHYTDMRIKSYQKRLGSESDILVIDCYAGLNPDALGALAGTIRLGGICILITPDDNPWCHYNDPELNRIVAYPYLAEQIKSQFIQYVITQLNQMANMVTFENSAQWVDYINGVSSQLDESTAVGSAPFHFSEQNNAIDSIEKLVPQASNLNAVIIEADRGRGKSAALGIAAANLMVLHPNMKLALIAPHRDSVISVFKHCHQQLDTLNQLSIDTNSVDSIELSSGAQLQFFAPDNIADIQSAHILLVDEAAAIPASVLQIALHNQIPAVFATTIHGYEGTGRAFEFKTKPMIKRVFDQVEQVILSQPIRWRDNDWLEFAVNTLLMLDGKQVAQLPSEVILSTLKLKQVSQLELAHDVRLLRQLFGLLVEAHYQTSPQDLRYLLDSPNVAIYALMSDETVIAASLVTHEGQIEPELAEGIWQGKRRIRGHLYPQSMICHAGFKAASQYQYARVVRIAVQPTLQNTGIGSLFITKLNERYIQTGYDFLCTSYGLSEPLYQFWSHLGFVPTRLGLKAETSTGEKSLLMAKALNDHCSDVLEQWQQRFEQVFYIENELLNRQQEAFLAKYFSTLNEKSIVISEQDTLDLLAFANYHRGLDTCLLALQKLVLVGQLKLTIPSFVSAKLIKGDNDKSIIKQYRFSGEKHYVTEFRAWCKSALIDLKLFD